MVFTHGYSGASLWVMQSHVCACAQQKQGAIQMRSAPRLPAVSNADSWWCFCRKLVSAASSSTAGVLELKREDAADAAQHMACTKFVYDTCMMQKRVYAHASCMLHVLQLLGQLPAPKRLGWVHRVPAHISHHISNTLWRNYMLQLDITPAPKLASSPPGA